MDIKNYFASLGTVILLMVTKKKNLVSASKHYLSASINTLRLLLLTKDDMESDSSPNRRFLNAELYFRTEDKKLFKISYQKSSANDYSWALTFKLKGQPDTLQYLDGGFMHYAFVEKGKCFFFGQFVTDKVTEIILVTNEVMEEYSNFQESELVKEFNS